MRVTHERGAARGVSQLMYVGDDAAVEGATTSWPTPVKLAIGVAIGWLLFRRR